MKRSRGRNRRSGGNNNSNHNNPNRHYESVGPDVKIRGSAQQVLDKYLQYARDAQTSGDRVTSEAYYQFAEHYQRIVAKQTAAKEKQRKEREDKDAQRREDRQKSSDKNSENNSDRNKSGDQNDASSDEGEKRAKGRRKKRDSEDRAEPAEAKDDATDASEDDAKPKKRRTYRKKSEEAVNVDETDGVMKTLSRGRKKPAADAADAKDGEVPVETAE